MNKIISIFALILLLSACKEKKQKNLNVIDRSSPSPVFYDNKSNTSSDEYHTDPNYRYEHRTGTSGDYEYNYDVSGDGVSGNVDMNGKYGSGTIEDENGEEKDIDAEWVGHGELEATDDDGNTYELEVD